MANTISQEEHERGKRRRMRQLLGVVLCLLILIGALNVLGAGVQAVAKLFDDTERRVAYEQKLQALVMLDPLPFESLAKADQQQFREYAIWATVFNAQRTAGGLDAYERDPDTDSAILPGVEVDATLAALVGTEYKIEHGTFESDGMNFYYDEEKQGYLVPVTGQIGRFTPKVEKLQKKDGKLRVTVGYVPTAAETGDYSMNASTEPTKYMDYVFEKVGKEYYLRALEASEMKASASVVASQPDTDIDYDIFDPTSVIADNAGLLPDDSSAVTEAEPGSNSTAEGEEGEGDGSSAPAE